MPPPVALADFFLALPRRALLNHHRGCSQLPFRCRTRRLSYPGAVGIGNTHQLSSDSHCPFLHPNLVSYINITTGGCRTTSNHGYQSMHNDRDRCHLRGSNIQFTGPNLYVHFLARGQA